jgi:hemerythrin-like metal-binding protein
MISALLTGNAIIDSQHMDLIAELDLLKNVMGDGEPPERRHILEFLHFLRGHFTTHFEMEENLMAEVAYPEWPLHANEHMQFFDVFVHYRAKIEYETNPGEATIALVKVVNDWVEGHVKGSDVRFATFYRAAKEEMARKGI